MRFLYIASVWPELSSSAAGLRSWGLIQALQSRGEVIVASPSGETKWKDRLKKSDFEVFSIQPNSSSFDEWIKHLRPDLVLFDRFIMEEQFGWRVAQAVPKALRVLDTQDLHFLRKARADALARGWSLKQVQALNGNFLRTSTCMRELASIYKCDLTLLVSSYERELLIKELGLPPELLMVHRFSYSFSRPQSSVPFGERRNVVMIGNFRHPPNHDASLWAAQTLWPRVREKLSQKGCSGVQLHLCGAYPQKEIGRLENNSIKVVGWVKDPILTLAQYRVSWAPLRFGAGIKGKISDSWRAGTPVVTTSIGAEGMVDEGPFPGWVEDDEEGLVDSCVAAYLGEAWEEKQECGYSVLESAYLANDLRASLLDKLKHLQSTYEKDRERNLIGEILNYHYYKSTHYLSKWIELKSAKEY